MFKIRSFISFMQFHSFLDLFHSFLLILILKRWVFFYPGTLALFHSDCCRLSFYVVYFYFLHCPWVKQLIEFAHYIGSTFLSNHIIAVYHICFYLRTMTSFHCHNFWLLYFEVFLWLLTTDDWDHSLGFLLTLEII